MQAARVHSLQVRQGLHLPATPPRGFDPLPAQRSSPPLPESSHITVEEEREVSITEEQAADDNFLNSLGLSDKEKREIRQSFGLRVEDKAIMKEKEKGHGMRKAATHLASSHPPRPRSEAPKVTPDGSRHRHKTTPTPAEPIAPAEPVLKAIVPSPLLPRSIAEVEAAQFKAQEEKAKEDKAKAKAEKAKDEPLLSPKSVDALKAKESKEAPAGSKEPKEDDFKLRVSKSVGGTISPFSIKANSSSHQARSPPFHEQRRDPR